MIDIDKWQTILSYTIWFEISFLTILVGVFITLHSQSGEFDIPPGNLLAIVGIIGLVLGLVGCIHTLMPIDPLEGYKQ